MNEANTVTITVDEYFELRQKAEKIIESMKQEVEVFEKMELPIEEQLKNAGARLNMKP